MAFISSILTAIYFNFLSLTSLSNTLCSCNIDSFACLIRSFYILSLLPGHTYVWKLNVYLASEFGNVDFCGNGADPFTATIEKICLKISCRLVDIYFEHICVTAPESPG